ncbi:MAG: hypothetical protein BGO31_18315 [Bacteroidetes bacterium 43-16]|nr:MAG: hypothetical protein BGO31_18315 [Bacteroidetes bacterium 43-16]
MKKLSLLLSVVLFSSAALFAGDDKKEKKAEACKKESSCCANKKTAKGSKDASATNIEEANTATKSKSVKSEHQVRQVSADELSSTPIKADLSIKQ